MSNENISDEEMHNKEQIPSEEMRQLPNDSIGRIPPLDDLDSSAIRPNETQEIWQEIRRLRELQERLTSQIEAVQIEPTTAIRRSRTNPARLAPSISIQDEERAANLFDIQQYQNQGDDDYYSMYGDLDSEENRITEYGPFCLIYSVQIQKGYYKQQRRALAQRIKRGAIEVSIFILLLCILMVCLPPQWLIKDVIFKSSTSYDLARKQLVTFGLLSDILYDLIFSIPFLICYANPQQLLKLRWQNQFKKGMERLDHLRQVVFGVLYITIDLIGWVYNQQGLFTQHFLSPEEKQQIEDLKQQDKLAYQFSIHFYSEIILNLIVRLIQFLFLATSIYQLNKQRRTSRFLVNTKSMQVKKRLDKMKTVEYQELQTTQVTTCCICLGEFEQGSSVCALKCHRSHVFHRKCFSLHVESCVQDARNMVKEWLQTAQPDTLPPPDKCQCPLCKQDIEFEQPFFTKQV